MHWPQSFSVLLRMKALTVMLLAFAAAASWACSGAVTRALTSWSDTTSLRGERIACVPFLPWNERKGPLEFRNRDAASLPLRPFRLDLHIQLSFAVVTKLAPLPGKGWTIGDGPFEVESGRAEERRSDLRDDRVSIPIRFEPRSCSR